MTIIVADAEAGLMAADTLIVYGYDKAGHAAKIVRGKDGSIGGACGDAAACCEFLAWVESGRKGKPKRKWFRHAEGLVLTKDRQILNYGGPVPDKLRGPRHAIGCGAPFAFAVMGMGASAVEGCNAAIKHSVACGGEVSILRLRAK